MKLYLDLLSQPCRAVYIFLKVNEIEFEFEKLELLHGMIFKVNLFGTARNIPFREWRA